MGRPWGIATVQSVDQVDGEAARWWPLMRQLKCRSLKIPILGSGEYQELSLRADSSTRGTDPNLDGELRLLETPDLTWDQVDELLAGQMLFLPVIGVRTLMITSPGFEPNTLVGGLDRLFALGRGSQLELTLRTAGLLAAHHQLAIEISP